ncbi:MAG: polysaccharide biosynthesis C-terminal domain-containing protein, partial [Alicyclobacillus sp.]|nr:polysaccharide biosynthesis C-terminal domain-containing protein [Alicyclobacillus sp.]
PLAFAMAVGASVLPAVAEAKALRDPLLIAERIRQTLRSLLFLTLPAAAALLVLNRPLDQLLFGSTEGANVIASVSLMSVLCSLELTSTYVLQGLGKMYRPVRNMFLGVLVKLVCNLLLIFPFHILGAAAATTIGYLVSATLNILAVKKYGELHRSVWRLTFPALLATVPLCGVLAGGQWLGARTAAMLHLPPDAAAALELTLALAPGAAVYLTAAVRFGAVRPDELRPLPAVGRRLARWAERWVPAPAAASRSR